LKPTLTHLRLNVTLSSIKNYFPKNRKNFWF
jgi:hypothetical protein